MVIQKQHIAQSINKTIAELLCVFLIFVSFCPATAIAAETKQTTVRVDYYVNEHFQEGTSDADVKSGYGYVFLTEAAKDVRSDEFDGKRILLAEDNDLNAEIAMELLKDAGFEIERAEDGAVCVDLFAKPINVRELMKELANILGQNIQKFRYSISQNLSRNSMKLEVDQSD